MAVLTAAAARAQRPFGVGTSTPPDPATVVQNRVAHLTARLGLTSHQASPATTATTQAVSIQNKADAAFYAILTPDRQTRLSQSHGRDFGGLGGMGMGCGQRNCDVMKEKV